MTDSSMLSIEVSTELLILFAGCSVAVLTCLDTHWRDVLDEEEVKSNVTGVGVTLDLKLCSESNESRRPTC